MTTNWAVQQLIEASGVIAASRVVDATPVVSSAIDLRTFDPGSRFLFALSAFETNAGNTGGTWTITESETSGGSYTAATLGGSLTATPASAGNNVQAVSLLPNPSKPFVKVTYTGADASAEVDVTATLLALPRVV